MEELQSYALLFSFSIFSAGLLGFFIRKIGKRTSSAQFPPSPPALPIIGHLHLLRPPTHQSMQKLAQRYGPLIQIRLGYVKAVLVSSASMAKQFLKTNDLVFSSRPVLSQANRKIYGPSGFAFAPYGPYWRFMKKLTVTELLSQRQLDRFSTIRRQELQQFLQLLFEKSDAGKSVDLEAELTTLTNSIVCRMSMGTKCLGDTNEAELCRKLVKGTMKYGAKFNPADYIIFGKYLGFLNLGVEKKLRELYSMYDELVERIIKRHEEKREMRSVGENEDLDLLDILLQIHEDNTGEVKITRQNIKSFFLDIFVAGTDTSALATQWAMAELLTHPKVFQKAREEIDSVVGTKRLVQESDLPRLPYLQATVKETLRLHPTAPLILRQSIEDCIVAGFFIPENTRIFINAYAIGRDPESWDEPLEFKPERFLISDEDDQNPIDVKGQHFQVIPFGSGRRACPGAALSLNIIQITIAAMIQCFDWKVEGGKVDMEEGLAFVLPMAHSLHVVPTSRFNPFSC